MKTALIVAAALGLTACALGSPRWSHFGPAQQYERVDDADRAFVRNYDRYGLGIMRKTPEVQP